ncbi:hypothetical protein C8J56DRAFT_1022363 [Mycena floridula]|nr:hypothetical protein C8J56DRAFT_1022363 [Mycena floridula]
MLNLERPIGRPAELGLNIMNEFEGKLCQEISCEAYYGRDMELEKNISRGEWGSNLICRADPGLFPIVFRMIDLLGGATNSLVPRVPGYDPLDWNSFVSQKMQIWSMVAAKFRANLKTKPQSGVNVEGISTGGPIDKIASDNDFSTKYFNIQGSQTVMFTFNSYKHQEQHQFRRASGSQSLELSLPDKPEDPTVQRLELEVAAVCKEFKCMLRDSYQQETASFREKCSEVVKDSISCADDGVSCALHHLNDLDCTIKAGGSAADIEWHLEELHREAVEGERCASNLQTRFHGIKALGVVTGWWQELIEALDQIDQSAKSDAHRTMELIEEQKYLGVKFRAYVSQMMDLQDRYPLLPSQPTKENSEHIEVSDDASEQVSTRVGHEGMPD